MSKRRTFSNGVAAHARPVLTQRPKIQASTKPFFCASVAADGVLELLVYEDIGEGWWDAGLTAKTIKAQIDAAGTFSKFVIRINSQGGDPFEAIGIRNIIRAQNKPVDVYVDSVAASAASIVAMAGDNIYMGVGSTMMIHNASSFCYGFASDMRKMAQDLDVVSGAIAQTYVNRTGKDLKDILALMDAETWMTADEAVAQGFATSVAADTDLADSARAMARQQFQALKRFKNVPADLKITAGVACTCDCENCIAGDCANCTNQDCDDANCVDCPMQEGATAHVPAPVRAAAPPNPKPQIPNPPAPAVDNTLYEREMARLERSPYLQR